MDTTDSELFNKKSFLERLEIYNANVKMKIMTTIKGDIQKSNSV